MAAASSGFVLFLLASAQFIMALDMSVMNVSIATVAEDLDTTVTGIQTAITLYTLVMACLMIIGGKIGGIIGRRRAFSLGCIIYACGSFTTAISQNLNQSALGWSLLEGIGAALVMPAIVALVAGNFEPKDAPRPTASSPPPRRSRSPSARSSAGSSRPMPRGATCSSARSS